MENLPDTLAVYPFRRSLLYMSVPQLALLLLNAFGRPASSHRSGGFHRSASQDNDARHFDRGQRKVKLLIAR